MNEERKIATEEVDGVAPPPRARVSDAAETLARKKDYLEGFLAQKPADRSHRHRARAAISTRR